jgi:uncharacterized membrane protein YccF (DUF307 family)
MTAPSADKPAPANTAGLESTVATVAEAAALVPAQAAPNDTQRAPLHAAVSVPSQTQPPVQMHPAPMQPTQVNVHVSAPAAPQIVIQVKQHGLFVRSLYFLFVGWWLSGWAIFAAGVCIASIVLTPAGLAIVNRIPQIMTMRPRSTAVNAAMLADGSMQYTVGNAEQRSMLVRAAYFCLVGWWAGMIAMAAAWVLSVLIVTMPLGLMLINRAPAVFTLRRN